MSAALKRIGLDSEPQRHRDDGKWIGEFLGDACDVKCPRCGKDSRVRYERHESWHVIAKFACAGCALSLQSPPCHAFSVELLPGAPWYGRVLNSGRRSCGYCGTRWLQYREVIESSDRVPIRAEASVRCHQCGNEYPLATICYRLRDWSTGCEPIFGMKLSLCEAVLPGKIVWAFNLSHLKELKNFVSAKLREQGVVANASMCSRLPAWMKSSRNRRKVLCAISRIEQQHSAQE